MDMANTAKRAAGVGLVTAIATQIYYGSQGSIGLLGQQVPASVGVGLAAGVGSVAADVAHQYLPSTPLGVIGASGVELGAAGLACAYALDMFGINNGITLEGGLIGAGGLVAGRQVNDYFGGSGGLF
jgi:hypothetical protein